MDGESSNSGRDAIALRSKGLLKIDGEEFNHKERKDPKEGKRQTIYIHRTGKV
jgi:hypothetical protein